MHVLVEAAVATVDAALAATDGGAQRLELCVDLAHGGTTPPSELIRDAVARVPIPVFVLVRPRAGNFVYSADEHHLMLAQIREAKQAGARGIVTGALTAAHAIAEARTIALISAARPLPVTFHRAFDECADQAAALETLIAHGVERVLTSGGAKTAADGVDRIAALVRQARGRIGILPGGGVDASNVATLVGVTGVREIHFSVNQAEKVRQVIRALKETTW